MIIYLKRKKLGKNLVVSQKVCTFAPAFDKMSVLSINFDRDLAQLVAHTSGGREVAGSSPVIPTKVKSLRISRFSGSFLLFRSKRRECVDVLVYFKR